MALSAIAAVGARNDGIAGLTDGFEAPHQGSFRSAPGFLPVVSTPSCQRLCSLQTTCPEYKAGKDV